MADTDLFADLPEFPVLHTGRLTLRELRDDDLPAAFRMFSNPEVMRYIGRPPHADLDETRHFLQRNRDLFPTRAGVRWVITRKGEDEFLGSCGHWRLMKEHLRAEIGYDLLPECWGQGLMGEALRAVLGFGFLHMGLHSVEAQIDPDHTRSRRVLERLGFRQDGLLRENYRCFDGRFTDTAVFTLLRREFLPSPA